MAGNLTTELATLAADQQALAATDLTTLQTFQTLLTTPGTTIADMEAASAVLPGQLGDPNRQAAAVGLLGGYQALLNNLAALIASTSLAAGNQ